MVKFDSSVPVNVVEWIKTDPYLLRNMPYFAWHVPTDRANNSYNFYPELTLKNPNPNMMYFGLIGGIWRRLRSE